MDEEDRIRLEEFRQLKKQIRGSNQPDRKNRLAMNASADNMLKSPRAYRCSLPIRPRLLYSVFCF
jgi:hypothetical protein